MFLHGLARRVVAFHSTVAIVWVEEVIHVEEARVKEMICMNSVVSEHCFGEDV